MFVKGQKKPAGSGRVAGTPNKKKPIVRQMLTDYTNTKQFWDKFIMELESLDGKDYVNAARGIFEIVEPKLTAITAEVSEKTKDASLIERLQALSDAAQG